MIKDKIFLIQLLVLTILMSSCNTNNKEQDIIREKSEFSSKIQLPERKVDLSYFKTEFGWGYNVEINGKNYIHQIHLPCECGGEGFKSKEKAILAAEFLKQKIENHERNLQINRVQLDSLGAL